MELFFQGGRGMWLKGLAVWFVAAAVACAQTDPPAQPSQTTNPPPGLLKECWDAAFLEGTQIGFIHTTFREVTLKGRPFIEASSELDLSLVRFGQELRLIILLANYETLAGKVRSVLVREGLSTKQQVTRKGVVASDLKEIEMSVQFGDKAPEEKKIPWNDSALGLYAQDQVYKARKIAPGDKFDLHRFEAVFDNVLTSRVEAKDL